MRSRSCNYTLVLLLWFLGVATGQVAAAGKQGGEPWPGLARGPYGVGFSVRHERDPDRLFGLQNAPRPVQMLVWYPTTDLGKKAEVTYQEYFLTGGTEVLFAALQESQKLEQLARIKRMVLSSGGSEKIYQRQLQRPTWAVANANPDPARFPLLVFAPGMSGAAFQNTILCEYLASHGFVVVASPSVGPRARDMPQTLEGVEAQMEDLRFVVRTMTKIRYVDARHIGLMGYSLGGTSALMGVMGDDPGVAAVVAMDPHLMVKQGHAMAQASPDYAPGNIRIPAMLAVASAQEWKERDNGFFDELTAAPAALLEFKDFTHGSFASTIVLFFQETDPARKKAAIKRTRFAYATLCRYTEAFFSAHLEGDAAAQAFLRAAPADHGVEEDVLVLRRKKMP